MIRHFYRCVMILVFLLSLAGTGCAQDDFSGWLNKRLQGRSEEIAKRVTIRNDVKQSDTPSISTNTTSLVDRSSAPDLVGVGLNLAGLTTNSREMEATSMSVTSTTYVLKAAAEGHDPLDPAYYNRNRDWRRLSITLGFDYPEDKAGDINERATIFGLKYLPYDKRDASDRDNRPDIDRVAAKLGQLAQQSAIVAREIQAYVYGALAANNVDMPQNANERFRAFFGADTWSKTYLNLLTDQERDEIDKIIERHISTFVEYRQLASETADKIRTKPQIAFSYLTKQRREMRPDEHMLEAIFDLAFAPRFTFTLNASFNYVDNKLMEDNRGGRFAGELQVQLNSDKLEGRRPVYLKLSGDGCWMTDMTPLYRAQAKVSIPILEGVEIPLSVTYASRTDLIKEADVRGKFGFTFDIARIAQALSGGLLGKRQ